MPLRSPRAGRLDARQPFLRCEAIKAGLTDLELSGPRFRQLFWGVHISASVAPTLALRCRAALLIAPSPALLTHHTAAILWGATVPPSPAIHVGILAGARLRAEGITTHRYAGLPASARRNGLPVPTPEQTFLDLASWLSLVDLVVLGDSLVGQGVTTPQRLVDTSADAHGRGARLARRAARLVRAGVDSPMETRVRLLFVLAGLPEPVVNFDIRDETGRTMYRIDLSFPDLFLAIEYDGRHHIARQGQWRQDLARREELESDGWRFVVLVAEDIYSTPEQTLARLVNAFAERGRRVRIRREEWRRYFPGRQPG